MFHPLDHNTLAATVEGHHSEIQRLYKDQKLFSDKRLVLKKIITGLCDRVQYKVKTYFQL